MVVYETIVLVHPVWNFSPNFDQESLANCQILVPLERMYRACRFSFVSDFCHRLDSAQNKAVQPIKDQLKSVILPRIASLEGLNSLFKKVSLHEDDHVLLCCYNETDVSARPWGHRGLDVTVSFSVPCLRLQLHLYNYIRTNACDNV